MLRLFECLEARLGIEEVIDWEMLRRGMLQLLSRGGNPDGGLASQRVGCMVLLALGVVLLVICVEERRGRVGRDVNWGVLEVHCFDSSTEISTISRLIPEIKSVEGMMLVEATSRLPDEEVMIFPAMVLPSSLVIYL